MFYDSRLDNEDRRYGGPTDDQGASAITQQQQGMVVMQQPVGGVAGAGPGMVPGVAMVQMAPQSLEALAPHMEVTVAAFRNERAEADGWKKHQISSVTGMVSEAVLFMFRVGCLYLIIISVETPRQIA